jgi:hypothetical protein
VTLLGDRISKRHDDRNNKHGPVEIPEGGEKTKSPINTPKAGSKRSVASTLLS